MTERAVNAIVIALMNTGDFPHFSASIDRYINLHYRNAGQSGSSGDNLPISV